MDGGIFLVGGVIEYCKRGQNKAFGQPGSESARYVGCWSGLFYIVCCLSGRKNLDVPVLMDLPREGIVVSGRRCMKERRDFFLEYVTVVEVILVAD